MGASCEAVVDQITSIFENFLVAELDPTPENESSEDYFHDNYATLMQSKIDEYGYFQTWQANTAIKNLQSMSLSTTYMEEYLSNEQTYTSFPYPVEKSASDTPSVVPSIEPSKMPTVSTAIPSNSPTHIPSNSPTHIPSTNHNTHVDSESSALMLSIFALTSLMLFA